MAENSNNSKVNSIHKPPSGFSRSQIENVIQENYNSIHPSVKWKFNNSAVDYLEKVQTNPKIQIDQIIFNDVFPLYGQVDIIGSSKIRNNSISKDLLLNLNLILDLLKLAEQLITNPAIHNTILKIEKERQLLHVSFNNLKESNIKYFIHHELHPLLQQLEDLNDSIRKPIQAYFQQLHPQLKLIYQERKAFEDSVEKLRKLLSIFLANAQLNAQKIIPHYFRVSKTDGIIYNIFAGQSILEKGKLDKLQLKKLRIWQLTNMCELTRISEGNGKSLSIPLKTAQLIYVHDSPISIHYRSEEKKFDINGAFNVSYEIIKKGIDKSTVIDTGERVTVAGKISIVYRVLKRVIEY